MKESQKESHKESIGAKHPLFAAANSGRGFVSFYDAVFDRKEILRRYIVKGGPGTGKSSFMRELAAYAEEQGMSVEYYRCSSDPDSLDGIVIDRRIAVMDGTAPHCVEPRTAGARDEIVNLGEFWDADRLAQHYNEIVCYSTLKSNAYEKSYRFLSAALEVSEINRSLIEPFVLEEKLKGAVERQLRSIPKGDGFDVRVGLIDSIGMKGSVRFDTYEAQAERVLVIDDCYGIAPRYLSHLIEGARKKECAIRVSYHPLEPTVPDAVLFEESGVCFVIGEPCEGKVDGRINMKRFISSERLGEIKCEYRLNRRLYEALIESAKDALREAGRYHFELEKIYVSCMDFVSQKKFLRSFCQKIR